MAKVTRQTQKIFGSSAGFQEIAQYGSLAAAAPVFTTDIATIQALSNYLGGWYDAIIGPNSPTIEDMNALHYLFAYQLAYLLQEGVAEWDAGTTYYAGSVVNNPVFAFTVSSANATVGATYTNNGQTFTVQTTIAAQTALVCTGTGVPLASGTLTKASGTGDATITFSAYAVNAGIYVSVADTNLGNAITNTTYWQAVMPNLGKAYQLLGVNSTRTAPEYTYSYINTQTVDKSLTVPAGYNLNSAFLTVPSGFSYICAGSMNIGAHIQATGTGIVQAIGTGIIRAY